MARASSPTFKFSSLPGVTFNKAHQWLFKRIRICARSLRMTRRQAIHKYLGYIMWPRLVVLQEQLDIFRQGAGEAPSTSSPLVYSSWPFLESAELGVTLPSPHRNVGPTYASHPRYHRNISPDTLYAHQITPLPSHFVIGHLLNVAESIRARRFFLAFLISFMPRLGGYAA